MTTTDRRGFPADPGLPGAEGLLGAPGVAVVSRFLSHRGWEAEDIRPVQATYRPGREALVRFRVPAVRGEAPRTLFVCADVRARRPDPAPVPIGFADRFGVDDPVADLGPYQVWAFPYDPSLRDLPDAVRGRRVRDRLGIPGPVSISAQVLRYRPHRRAVVRYYAIRPGREREVLFGKVLRAAKRRRLAEARRAVAPRRTPVSLALPSAADGELVLFPALTGRSLRRLLLEGGSLPGPGRVAAVLDDLGRGADLGAFSPSPTPDPVETARRGADLVSRLVPEAASDAARVVRAVEIGATRSPARMRVVHGDLYEDQLLVEADFSLGLVDLDGFGPGDAAADAANFSAHLLALALVAPAARPRLLAYRRLVNAAFAARLDAAPWELAWREALAMLLLSLGPFRVLAPSWPREVHRRVRLAVRLGEE